MTTTLHFTQGRSVSGRARCADGNGTLSGLFFSDDDVDIARAQAICRACAMQTACLTGALERGENSGVWGGMLIQDGVPRERRRGRGRPRHSAAVPLVVDEVPIPPHLVA